MDVKEYADLINLFEPYDSEPINLAIEEKNTLVNSLLSEINPSYIQGIYEERRRNLRGLLNTLPPNILKKESVQKLNTLLRSELSEKTLIDPEDLISDESHFIGITNVLLFQGDITTLKVDAIVNAANSQLLGCFQPLHSCIDNVIHSAAGVQLRDDCQIIMDLQGHEEATGDVKITRAYNLPSRFVLHTVGPIVRGIPGPVDKMKLESSYLNCLEMAKELEEVRSIAFCCISTGVFGYPQQDAAEVAFSFVTNWLEQHPNALDHIIFNVFTDKDREIYKSLMEEKWKLQQ